MFCVIYEFTVTKENETAFKNVWHELTQRIYEESGSLGSRLHKVIEVENTWVAYAQWPSQSIYGGSSPDVSYKDLRERFVELCSGVKILYQMESVDDLLVGLPSSIQH